MKTLTSAFDTARPETGLSPVCLVKIELLANGANPALTLRLAEYGDDGGEDYATPSNTWKALLQNVQKNGASLNAETGFQQVSESFRITVLNNPTDLISGTKRFSTIFTDYKPETARVTVYNWLDGEGLSESDMDVEFVGNIALPIKADEAVCSFDVVAETHKFGTRHLGERINLTDYPDAPDESLGQFKNIIIGNMEKVPCRRVTTAARTRLRSLFLRTDAALLVEGPTTKYPSSGVLVINGDEVSYTGKTSNSFTGCSGARDDHFPGEVAIEKVTDHQYLAFGPEYDHKSMGDVYVKPNLDGDYQLVDSSKYSQDLNTGKVIFDDHPTARVAADTRITEDEGALDVVDGSNTASNASNALDYDSLNSVASINQSLPTLALKKSVEIEPLGEISRVVLETLYFSEEKTPNDYVQVSIDGVGDIGRLDPQADDDLATVAGTVAASHSHTDTIAAPFSDPSHTHLEAGNRVQTQSGSAFVNKSASYPAFQSSFTINFNGLPTGASSTEYSFVLSDLNVTAGYNSVTIYLPSLGSPVNGYNVIARYSGGAWTFFPPITALGASANTTLQITALLSGPGPGGTFTWSMSPSRNITIGQQNVQSKTTGGSTSKTGSVQTGSGTLNTSNTTEKASNLLRKNIDITSQWSSDGTWDWFTDKIFKWVYTGSADGRTIHIVGARLVIVYAQIREEPTDFVFVDVEGVKDDGSGTITGSADALIERPDHVFDWSIRNGLGLAAATYINATSFSAAGTSYGNAISGGYKLAGIIDRAQEVRRLWNEWAVQTRSLFWFRRGKAELFFMPENGSANSTTTVRDLDEDDLFIDEQSGVTELQMQRTPEDQVVNRIDLRYKLDWFTGEWLADPELQTDATSQTRYGVREEPDFFQFQWVRQQAMAEHLAQFYILERKEIFKVAVFNSPYANMDLEMGDVVGLAHELVDGSGLLAKPGLLLAANRQIGNGSRGVGDEMQFILRLVNAGTQANDGYGIATYGTSAYGGQNILDS